MSLRTFLKKTCGSKWTWDVSDHLQSVNTLTSDVSFEVKGEINLHMVEEMSEVTKEVIKIYVRGKGDREDSYYEELADVIILLDQVLEFVDEDKLYDALVAKCDRFKNKYPNGRENNVVV